MSYLIRRVLAKSRLILDEMCRLYGKFASYFSSYKWPYCYFAAYKQLSFTVHKEMYRIYANYAALINFFSKNAALI